MKFTKEIEKTIKTFIIEQVPSHKNDIVTFTMKHFGISKPTAAKFLNQLISENIIEMNRKGRYPDYSLITKEPVKLMEYEGELLLSRSQAKKLITRFDKFLEVVFDFQGVTEIDQAFADEVFRVFRNMHPNVHLVPINCSPTVQRMIAYISADYFQNIYTS